MDELLYYLRHKKENCCVFHWCINPKFNPIIWLHWFNHSLTEHTGEFNIKRWVKQNENELDESNKKCYVSAWWNWCSKLVAYWNNELQFSPMVDNDVIYMDWKLPISVKYSLFIGWNWWNNTNYRSY